MSALSEVLKAASGFTRLLGIAGSRVSLRSGTCAPNTVLHPTYPLSLPLNVRYRDRLVLAASLFVGMQTTRLDWMTAKTEAVMMQHMTQY